MTSKTAENVVEIRVDDIAQLFHTLDPFPFREKDLDREAEEYIVGWARELPADQPFRIIVHLPDDQSQADLARDLPEALSKYFNGRAAVLQGDLNELFRNRAPIPCRRRGDPRRLSACSTASVRIPRRCAVQEDGGRKPPDPGMGRQLAAA